MMINSVYSGFEQGGNLIVQAAHLIKQAANLKRISNACLSVCLPKTTLNKQQILKKITGRLND